MYTHTHWRQILQKLNLDNELESILYVVRKRLTGEQREPGSTSPLKPASTRAVCGRSWRPAGHLNGDLVEAALLLVVGVVADQILAVDLRADFGNRLFQALLLGERESPCRRYPW